MTRTYIGRVDPHASIQSLISTDNNTEQAFEIFQDYWKLGYDAEVGRDTYLSRPNAAKDSAIGRVHLRPVHFTGTELEDHGYTATEECWDKWPDLADVPAVDSASGKIPTSNEWIVYCVDSERNSCMLAYLPEAIDPHTFCEDTDNMQKFIDMAEQWFSEHKSTPMENSEFPHIFSDKWLAP